MTKTYLMKGDIVFQDNFNYWVAEESTDVRTIKDCRNNKVMHHLNLNAYIAELKRQRKSWQKGFWHKFTGINIHSKSLEQALKIRKNNA